MRLINDIEFYTIQEAAEMMGVSLPTIRRYINDKKLKSRRLGRSIFVTKNEISEFLKVK